MGQPHLETGDRPRYAAEGTGGTETSHVPRGKERIPVVAASEPGGAQTISAYEAAAAAGVGLNVMTGAHSRVLARRVWPSRAVLEQRTGEGESPVGDGATRRVRHEREYRRTREIRWEAGSPTTQG